MIRTFIGLELSDAVVTHLVKRVDALYRIAPQIRWVHRDALHLTLRFLGNLPAEDLREVFDAVECTAAETAPLILAIRGIGVFPDTRRTRTVWAGIHQGENELLALVDALSDTLAACGYPPERRPFHPHVTLGRVSHPRDAEPLAPYYADLESVSYGSCEISHLVVFMSELRRGGARYTPMQRVPLGG